MKLQVKTALLYLSVTLLLFPGAGFLYYHFLKDSFEEEVVENLYISKKNLIKHIENYKAFPENQILFNGNYSYKKCNSNIEIVHDTLIYDHSEKEEVLYKELIFPLKLQNVSYSVHISIPLFESDDIIDTIASTLLITVSFLFLIMFLVTGIFSIRIWKPFFNTLDSISKYQQNPQVPLKFEKVNTKEFEKLNKAIEEMTIKIQEHFNQLKSFTENASHEIQTPLTAIRLETEELLQNSKFDEKDLKHIHNIHNSAVRLSKTNESLLLLAKINNNQFLMENSDISSLLAERIEHFSDRIGLKNIDIRVKNNDKIIIKTSPVLFSLLVSNLLSNSIKHNISGGFINIELNKEYLLISNTGNSLPFEQSLLFQKFVRNIEVKDSTGLGLALVKEISDSNGWKIQYQFENNIHFFYLYFK